MEDLSESEQNRIYRKARKGYADLIKLQFQLCYHAHISIRDSDNMTHYEIEAFYEELKAQKEEENRVIEESKAKAKSKRR